MNDKRLKRRGTKNGKAVWTARTPLPRAADGKRRTHRFTFVGTQKDAERAFVDALTRIEKGSFVATERTTFGQYIAEFLSRSKGTFALKTWERFDQMARTHVVPKLGDIPLQKLRASHLNDAYAAWRESGLSGQTVIHHHRFIHRTLAEALREDRILQNVAASATKPKAPRREMRFLGAEEIAKIFRAAEGTQYSPLIALALATGARRGELLGLKWGDVDFAGGAVAIRRSLEETKSGVAEKTPKSGKSRVVALTLGALETLRQHRLRVADAQGIGRTAATNYLFANDDGTAWRPHKVTEGFRRLARRAGIVPLPTRKRPTTRAGRRWPPEIKKTGALRRGGEITFHSLRHTCASMLLAQGVHPKVVQEMLGHSTVSITMDLYSHTTPTLQSDAVRRLDSILRLPDAGSATA